MKSFFFTGIAIFLLGILIVRGRLRSYREDVDRALSDDLWDWINGRSLTIVTGVFLILLGAGMVFLAFVSDASVSFSSTSPFITVTHHPAQQP